MSTVSTQQFGPQNWNPTPGATTYCSWDLANQKSCKQHRYEEGKRTQLHLSINFALVTTGKRENLTNVSSDLSLYKGLMYLAHQAGAEVYPSIGGWTLSDAFPSMAASSSARKRFASQCVELIEDYGFDGIDLDWEYPGYSGKCFYLWSVIKFITSSKV